VQAFASLTVIPSAEMWARAGKAFGLGAYHWFLFAQPYDLPERLLSGDPDYFLDWTLRKMAKDPGCLSEEALAAYRAAFRRPEVRHAMMQDYRAGAMPETAALIGRLRAAGIPAVVSGAGPSVLAFLGGPEKSDYRHHLDSLGSIVRETGIAWHISSLDVERQGARVLLPEPLSG